MDQQYAGHAHRTGMASHSWPKGRNACIPHRAVIGASILAPIHPVAHGQYLWYWSMAGGACMHGLPVYCLHAEAMTRQAAEELAGLYGLAMPAMPTNMHSLL